MTEKKNLTERTGADSDPHGTRSVRDVVVAVLTYRRPEDIALALPRLAAQVLAATDAGSLEVSQSSVLVIDNDPAASAESAVRQIAAAHPAGLVRYVHEPRPGIAAARNRALADSADRTFLVFIDDDEVPSGEWLLQLLQLQQRTGAAAVVGPVVSEFEHEPEPWIVAGQFFRRRRLASGSHLRVAATNNLLLDMRQIRAMQLTFDERFGLSGGSDTLFTRQLILRGGLMLWCDEAVVMDRVPASRLTRSWVMRRALRSGNSATRVSLELAGRPARRLAARGATFAAGSLRLAGGSARLAAGLASGSMTQRAKGLRTMARGAGMALGAVGYVYSEYRRK